jgi:perosamine synthetase
MSQNMRIPWARPEFWGKEQEHVLDALSSTWISGGPYVEHLERDIAGYCGVQHAISATNGTAAIHMAYLALGVGPGDEVILPGFGFMAAANIALHVGAQPVFAEVDPSTWCATADTMASCITPRTRLIVPIHTYGNLCPMDDLLELSRVKAIRVMEDAAESFGSAWNKRKCGTFGVCGTLSFHATKTIATGEGGMVLTDDAELYERMWLYRNHGVKTRRYWHELAGHNFRMTNLQAAIGCAQFEALGKIIPARKRMDTEYRKALVGLDGVTFQLFQEEVAPVVWAIAVRLDPAAFPQGRDAVISQFAEVGIETRPGFYSASQLSHLYQSRPLPICDALASQIISLPSYPTISEEDLHDVCNVLSRLRR